MKFADKKILLTAFSVVEGSESISIYNYLKKNGASNITALYWGGDKVGDSIPDDVKKIEVNGLNDFNPELTKDFDIVFRHTATRPELIDSSVEKTSLTQEFFEKCPASIIGVTGTKGKGTTSTLIAKILEADGKKVHLIGNIGRPALDELEDISGDDFVIYELSSFQLWDLELSPHISVVLMIEPDHMDVHKNMDEYIAAKSNIVKHQSSEDVVYYHPNNIYSEQIAGAGVGQKIKYMTKDSAYVEEGSIVLDGREICNAQEVGLIGKHNLENICAAVSAVGEFVDDIDTITKTIKSFTGLEHRLQKIGEVQGVSYIDDSISTIPSTAAAAIQAFDAPVVLIAGGSDKGLDYKELIETVCKSDVKFVVALGETGKQIAEELKDSSYEHVELAESMPGAVEVAARESSTGDVVLLSPGSASFGMFNNYKDRAERFIEAVGSL